MRRPQLARRLGRVVAAPLALAWVLTGLGTSTASAATCSGWTGAQPPNPGTTATGLSGVAAVSVCDVWAVGTANSAFTYQTMIEHWAGGSSWTVVPSPNPGTQNFLSAVTAVSATNIWAVGSLENENSDVRNATLILHRTACWHARR